MFCKLCVLSYTARVSKALTVHSYSHGVEVLWVSEVAREVRGKWLKPASNPITPKVSKAMLGGSGTNCALKNWRPKSGPSRGNHPAVNVPWPTNSKRSMHKECIAGDRVLNYLWIRRISLALGFGPLAYAHLEEAIQSPRRAPAAPQPCTIRSRHHPVRRAAPGAAIAFNTRPDDSADAAARWVAAGSRTLMHNFTRGLTGRNVRPGRLEQAKRSLNNELLRPDGCNTRSDRCWSKLAQLPLYRPNPSHSA